MWQQLKDNGESVQTFQSRFLFPIFGLIAVTHFVGGLWIVENGSRSVALRSALMSVVAAFGGYYGVVYLLHYISEKAKWGVKLYDLQRFVGYSSIIMYLLFLVLPFVTHFNYYYIFVGLFVLFTGYIVDRGSAVFLNLKGRARSRFSEVSTFFIITIPAFLYFLLHFALFH